MTEDLIAKALAALRQKDFLTARTAIAAYAQDNALELQHFLIKGLSELALAEWSAAAKTFTDAIEAFPHQPQLWLNLGIAQENLGYVDEAAESFEESIDLKNNQGDAYGNLSNLYRKQGRFDEAVAMAHLAFEHGAPKAQALNSLGLAHGKQGKFEAATRTFNEALQFDPTNADIHANIANLAIDQLRFNDAWPAFSKARTLQDSATLKRDEGMARLLTGDFAKGWPLYEARLELPTALRTRPPCPIYKGEMLAGKKLLLVAEQGFGDTIMFCRYGELLAKQGAELLWYVQKPLQWLLKGNLPGKLFTEEDPLPEADYYLPLLSLPLVTGKLDPWDISSAPYMEVSVSPELPQAITGKRKIGLVWTGSPTHERDHERSIPLGVFAPLFNRKDIQLFAPFTGAGLEEITSATPVISLASSIKDFADTAALLKQMECLVTVDTAVAHLAGALGVKTYLLLPHCPDWRWGTTGEKTPWYNSMTLLRQPSYGDWESVISTLAEKLT